jgi:hypothetical protein
LCGALKIDVKDYLWQNDGGSSNLEKSTSIKEGIKCCHLKKSQ